MSRIIATLLIPQPGRASTDYGKLHASLALYLLGWGQCSELGSPWLLTLIMRIIVMAYDWSGVQTRRNRRLRLALLTLVAVVVFTAPIVATELIKIF